MIRKINKEDFDGVFRIMEKSFPIDEFRTYEEQKALMDNNLYSIYGNYGENGGVKAFIAVWEFSEFVYVEHFAVDPDCRNGGLGGKILHALMSQTDKPVCLEVEPPETEMAERRINFYRRNGFFLNEYPYMQPAISKGRNPLPLMIMTTGSSISQEKFQDIRDTLYKEVYKCKVENI